MAPLPTTESYGYSVYSYTCIYPLNVEDFVVENPHDILLLFFVRKKLNFGLRVCRIFSCDYCLNPIVLHFYFSSSSTIRYTATTASNTCISCGSSSSFGLYVAFYLYGREVKNKILNFTTTSGLLIIL